MASISKRQLSKGSAFDVRYRDPNGRARMKTLPSFGRGAGVREDRRGGRRARRLPPAGAGAHPLRPMGAGLAVQHRRPSAEDPSRLRVDVAGQRPAPLLRLAGWPDRTHARPPVPRRPAGEGRRPGTVRAARKVLRLVLATAVEGGALRSNPCTGIRLARSDPVEMAFLTMDQVLALATAMRRPEYGLLVRFAALSGLRAGEIGAVRVGRLDLLRGRVEVAERAWPK